MPADRKGITCDLNIEVDLNNLPPNEFKEAKMTEKTDETKKPVSKRALTAPEQKMIADLKEKGSVETRPIFQARETDDKVNLDLVLDNNLEHQNKWDLFDSSVMKSTGCADRDVGLHFLSKVANALISAKANNKEIAQILNTIAQTLQTLAPQDLFEAQLIGQLIILHEQSMDWLGRANRSERVDFANVYLNGASKLLTRHHETLDTLLKYRRKGIQRVHVEHVHVHEGGQAVVGNIVTGGGMKPIFEEGPHAKV